MQPKGYVINLIASTPGRGREYINDYGYWTGKFYTVQGEYYPVCDNQISKDTKFYKSRKIAENSAKRCIEKFIYVIDAEVVEFDDEEEDNDNN